MAGLNPSMRSCTSPCAAYNAFKSSTAALLLVALLCCRQPAVANACLLGPCSPPPPAPTVSYVLTETSASLQAMCLGSANASNANFATPDYFLVGSTTSVADGVTVCASSITLLKFQASTSTYSSISVGSLPAGAGYTGWKVSNWQATATDIVQLTVTNEGLLPLLVTSLSSLLSVLPLVGSSVVQAPATSFNRTFFSLPQVQSYFLSLSPPTAGTLQAAAIVYGGSVTYVWYQADASGAISFYIFEAAFSGSARRRKLLASSDGSTQGSSCVCHNNPNPAPSCVNGNSAYPGCRYICSC